MSSTERIEAVAELAATIANLNSGAVSFVEGVRRLLSLRDRLGSSESAPDFAVLVAVDSESDHLAVGKAKAFASPAWFERCARDEQELRNRTAPAVAAACERLMKRFASDA